MNLVAQITVSLALLGCVLAATSVKSKSYTTSEDVSSSKTLFVSHFSFEGDQPRGMLYAEVGEKSLIVGKSNDGLSYQVSWTENHKSAASGIYVVKVYNEEGHANMRKAKRDGDAAAEPLATLEINHQGVWKGPWMSSETVACIAATLLMYLAYSKKSEILS